MLNLFQETLAFEHTLAHLASASIQAFKDAGGHGWSTKLSSQAGP
jgi:hypothetical protein